MSRRGGNDGFSLAALIFFLTATSILMAAVVPVWTMQARRIQEQELIFRGEEYMRAIHKYWRKFQTYPPSIDALLETNGIRFLRKEYLDPITGKPFRLLELNPDGTISGSTLFGRRVNDQPIFGGSLPSAGGSGSTASPGTRGSEPGESGNRGAAPFGQSSGQPSDAPTGAPPGGPLGGQLSPGQNPSFGTSGIVGVASESELESIMVYNGRQTYNEWEFIALLQPGQMGGPSGNNPDGGNPGEGGNPGGQNPQPNPGINPGGFGPGFDPGTRPGMNPFSPNPGSTPSPFGNPPGGFRSPESPRGGQPGRPAGPRGRGGRGPGQL